MDARYAVQLTVPAQAGSARLARLMAAAVAADAGFTLDETEDLRVAVSELVALLVEDAQNGADEVMLNYQRASHIVEVTGQRTFASADESADASTDDSTDDSTDVSANDSTSGEPAASVTLDDLALEILRVMVDEHDFTHDESGRRFRLVKRTRTHA